MMGKLIWLWGRPAPGKIACWRNSACGNNSATGGASLHHARRQRWKRKHIALSEQEFFTRAGQNLLALAGTLTVCIMASASRLTSGCSWIRRAGQRLTRPSAAGAGAYQSALLPICLQVSPEILRQRWKTVAAKTPVKLTPGWRAPPLYSTGLPYAQ